LKHHFKSLTFASTKQIEEDCTSISNVSENLSINRRIEIKRQFHQPSMRSFCASKVQTKNVSTKKLRAQLTYVKAARRIMVKLTPSVNFINLMAQSANAPVVILKHLLRRSDVNPTKL
jgi:hypothetical protein